jgi:thiamine biosynthesis lipoprotein
MATALREKAQVSHSLTTWGQIGKGLEYDYFQAMGSGILLTAEGPDVTRGFGQARQFIESSEQRFTRFSQQSELTGLNQAAGGGWLAVSPEMFDLVEIALECYWATDGLFDPSILPDLEQAGYPHSLTELPGAELDFLSVPRSRPGLPAFGDIDLRHADLSIRIPAGMRIDLGGIAKGWIAEQAAQRLSQFSSCCAVNAAGDMFFWGSPAGKPGWEVCLEDPRYPSEDLMILGVENGAVATSSVTKRVWKQGNTTRHHLIDPRTGEPAQTPWLSVTVLAPCAASAEAFAKAVLIAGPENARALVEKNPQITCFAVDSGGRVLALANGACVCLKAAV